MQQSQLQINGHAIEARVYAENPEKGFLPSIGTLIHARTPQAVTFELGGQPDPAGFRIDSGVREGDTISPFYDPMIAKMIVWGKDRNEALARMSQALAQYQIVGLSSNIGFLQRLIQSQAFSRADLDTGLIERNQAELFSPSVSPDLSNVALAALRLVQDEDTNDGQNPWTSSHGWRMNSSLSRTLRFEREDEKYDVTLRYSLDGWRIASNNEQVSEQALVRLVGVNQTEQSLTIQYGDQIVSGTVVRHGEHIHVFSQGQHIALSYADPLLHAGEAEAEAGRLTAPMPGKIVALLVAAGESVKKGAPLLIMEAMKLCWVYC